MRDSFGREINYLRISITDRCNLRCEYCLPEGGIKNKIPHSEILTLEELYQITKTFVDVGIDKVRFTGGEPLVRFGAVDLIKKVNALDGIKEVTLTTNGILLDDYLDDLVDAGVKRLNISLDTLDAEKYRRITRGGDINRVLLGIRHAREKGIKPIKINTVLIGGFNHDEITDLVELTRDGAVDVRFIELMPIGEASSFAKSMFLSTKEILKIVPSLELIETEDPSAPATYYRLSDGEGKVGLINPISCKFCTNCNRVRLTATGKLKLCLHSDREIDLKVVLREGGDLEKTIRDAILTKDEEHNLENEEYIKRNMNQIGG